jgi:hypothetical protein
MTFLVRLSLFVVVVVFSQRVSPSEVPVSKLSIVFHGYKSIHLNHKHHVCYHSRSPRLMLRGGNSHETAGYDEMHDRADSDDAEWVQMDIEYACSGRNDVLSILVDADTRIVDFKRSLYSNFSHILCDADRMQLWWRGQELIGAGDETLSMYGIDRTVAKPRILLKETASDRFQDSFGRGMPTESQLGPGYGNYGMAGDGMRDPVTSSLLSMINDPAQLKYFIESNPQMQELLKTNPEVMSIPPML